MAVVKLKIDVGGTIGDEAWRRIEHFDPIQEARFGPECGSNGECGHAAAEPHTAGEWQGARIRVQTPLLAQYALAHYLQQKRVLDADVE